MLMQKNNNSKQQIKEIKSLKELKALSLALIQDLKAPQLILLKGQMGSGKSQTVRYMAQGLGCPVGEIRSPAFSLIHVHFSRKRGQLPIYHIDLFRLKKPEELDFKGFWDIFHSPAFVFIEWPELIQDMLPAHWRRLCIEIHFAQKNGERILKWESQENL